MTQRRAVVFGVAALLVLAQLRFGAQDIVKLPARPGDPPGRVVIVDDQIFDAEAVVIDNRGFIRPRGATTDTRSFGWGGTTVGVKFLGWEGGVLPVEFEDAITQTQRDQFMRACAGWGRVAPVMCVVRTSQLGFIRATLTQSNPAVVTCSSNVGQFRDLVQYSINLPSACWNDRSLHHELGHAFGFVHEHQRPDRDAYVFIDTANVIPSLVGNFTLLGLREPLGPYDFGSVMHYPGNAFAVDSTKPTIIPQEGYGSFAASLGRASLPSDLDHQALREFYALEMRPLVRLSPAGSPTTRFDRTEFLAAMERLHAFYFSRYGLNRASGLSINGRPDFLGIATWIFDVYLGARSRGFLPEQAFGIVFADITQTDEWRGKHPGQAPLTRPSFAPLVNFDRTEFLDALQRLDAFYASAVGLQRPNGLSIANGPDFLGIATWIFDVYLSERLRGSSPNVAWTRVVNAIQDTDEWKRKH